MTTDDEYKLEILGELFALHQFEEPELAAAKGILAEAEVLLQGRGRAAREIEG
jgi:hypothetical protein